jgi:acyl CoA:acetate/3-ketoacid CoA transferase alpha subunit
MLRFAVGRGFSKIFKTPLEAIHDLKEGQKVLMGGFGLCGIPEHLIEAVRQKGTKDLTVVSNTGGVADWGLGILLQSKQIKRMIASYVGENKVF